MLKLKRSRKCDISLGDILSDGISFNSSTQKYNKANSKIEKYANSSEEILTDLLHQNDKSMME